METTETAAPAPAEENSEEKEKKENQNSDESPDAEVNPVVNKERTKRSGEGGFNYVPRKVKCFSKAHKVSD